MRQKSKKRHLTVAGGLHVARGHGRVSSEVASAAVDLLDADTSRRKQEHGRVKSLLIDNLVGGGDKSPSKRLQARGNRLLEDACSSDRYSCGCSCRRGGAKQPTRASNVVKVRNLW